MHHQEFLFLNKILVKILISVIIKLYLFFSYFILLLAIRSCIYRESLTHAHLLCIIQVKWLTIKFLSQGSLNATITWLEEVNRVLQMRVWHLF